MKPIQTWAELNDILRDADEETCKEMLQVESKGPKRKVFMFRIHSRLNKVRAARERRELEDVVEK